MAGQSCRKALVSTVLLAMLTVAAGRRVQNAERNVQVKEVATSKQPYKALALVLMTLVPEPTAAFSVPGRPGGALTTAGSATQLLSLPRENAFRSGEPQMVDRSKKIPDKNVFVEFVDAKDVPPGTITSGFRYGLEVAFANEKGTIYALSNKLPPTGQPATFGKLSGDGTIEEPISGTKFDLKTGKVVGPWCPSAVGQLQKLLIQPSDVQIFKAKKTGNKIQAQININAKAQFEQTYWRGVLDSQGKVDGGYY